MLTIPLGIVYTLQVYVFNFTIFLVKDNKYRYRED